MKLVIAIINDEDAGALVRALVSADFGVTKLATTGGFLKSGNTTLLIGTTVERLDELTHIIEKNCKTRKGTVTTPPLLGETSVMSVPVEITVGGATLFVLDIEKFIKL